MDEFDDPFDLFPLSRPSGQRTADGREIRLVGSPILGMNPATNDLLAIAEYQDHPLVSHRYFYSLPEGLIDALVSAVGEASFDPQLLAMERTISRVCGDHTLAVGIRQESTVSYQHLRKCPLAQFTDEDIREAGMNPLEFRNVMRVYEARDQLPLQRFRRGYVGWLLTHRTFLDEHDQLLSAHAATVRRWGTHLAGIALPPGYLMPGTDPHEDPQWPEFCGAMESFCSRWRLQGFAGPYLPNPLQALMAGSFPWTTVQQLMQAGGVFFLPDTMPIPARDQLRGMLDDALHRQMPAHLKEWLQIVRAGNMARNQLGRFARLLEVQHYWRLLNQRHPSALNSNIGRFEEALAQFFDLSAATIHADLNFIRQRLGADWLERQCPI